MDARIRDWVVTPCYGKPVEINALWLNALAVMDRSLSIIAIALGISDHLIDRLDVARRVSSDGRESAGGLDAANAGGQEVRRPQA